MTVTERIIAKAAGIAHVAPGEEVWVNVDLAIMNDSSGPRRFDSILEELGGKIWDPQKVAVVSDHFVPPSNPRHTVILEQTRRWAKAKGVHKFFEFDGIMHNLLIERRIVQPGMLVAGADSHTVTAGASGCVAIPIGSNELATVLATGQLWMVVPATIRVILEGTLPEGLSPRDIDFHMFRELNSDFANYCSLEFAGSLVEHLSVEQRAVLTNASIEIGAKNAVVPFDSVTSSWLNDWWGDSVNPEVYRHDPNASFQRTLVIDVGTLEPFVAGPHSVNNIRPVSLIERTPLTVAHLGSCVGSSIEDLRSAATVLRNRRVEVPLIVTPATRRTVERAIEEGIAKVLVEAGATIQAPGCGPCAGVHMGVLGPGDRAITSFTRNYKGRMGSSEAEIYLGSPATVAASALAGEIADPRNYL
jgi:3-isopropylmalate/(R)-2-methylmalate dehydratase large subunit